METFDILYTKNKVLQLILKGIFYISDQSFLKAHFFLFSLAFYQQ